MPSRAAIDELYLAFADCSLPGAMGYCSYCDTAECEEALHGDLRTLRPELVDKYIWDAIHHTGDEKDFKHFVPRIYELLAKGELPFADPEMVLGRLAMAGWGEWPEIQQRALKTVLDGLWDEVMSSQSPPVGIEDLVCGLCLAYRGLAPWLSEWISDSRPIAIQRLAEFVLANETDLALHKLSDPWWNSHEMREVVDWALSDNVVNHLRNTDVSALTASAAALLARLRAAPST